ncbi:inositol phosphorylceramide synthase [Candidatus Daviesbacteria bacterium]|nr:inositol phosphorylceramide synthase [Candidatus Daviesbacteria bacterium]MBI4028880.1 inositol phosphorylceramide synthase [Candidatus Blackburnbacteria bacterium]
MGKSIFNITSLIALAYIIIISIYLFWHRVGFSPDQFFAVALLITLLLGRMKQFIRDWSIPVVLFLSYDYLRGLTPKLNMEANIFPMINFDRLVFGEIPTNTLQTLLFSKGTLSWIDYLATIFYMSHFVVPLVIAFAFWFKKKKYFEEYALALILISYAAFITYVLFPAVPPWMASEKDVIPQVHKIMDQTFLALPQRIDLPSVYRFFGANLVAAVPSLHAAYPWLTLLFLVRKFKAVGWLFLPYVLGVWFSIVYLGEHYVFDIIIGVLYAIVVYLLIFKIAKERGVIATSQNTKI